MNLQEAYDALPQDLRDEYTFEDVKNHVFAGSPKVPSIERYLKENQLESISIWGPAFQITFSRQIVAKNEIASEDELEKLLRNENAYRVWEMSQKSEEELFEEIGKEVTKGEISKLHNQNPIQNN